MAGVFILKNNLTLKRQTPKVAPIGLIFSALPPLFI
jgi:hypothetical protein